MTYSLPLSNGLSNQLFATGSTVDMLKWDSTCLDSLAVPDGIDQRDVINCILEIYGDQTLAHPDPDYMRYYVGVWSKRRLPIWKKLVETTQYEYNPIWNFDRTERYTDSTDHTSTGTSELTSTDSGTSTVNGKIDRSEESEQKVSAENVSSYQPDNKTENGIEERSDQTTETTATAKDSGKNVVEEQTSFVHEARLTGNIGITSTQSMIAEERKIVNFSVIEVIAQEYSERFCLGIY